MVGRGLVRPRVETSRFTAVLTLVLWVGAALVGVLGLTLSYARPSSAVVAAAPLTVEILQVELTAEPLPEIPAFFAASEASLSPPPDAILQPELPPAVAVAVPAPQIAFAVPVAGPTRLVEVAHAGYSAQPMQTGATETLAHPVQSLTFGQGAGRQPAPDYPMRAQREKQEGVVNVRFTVAENGRVAAAETIEASPWPLLNDSAVRTIRSRWRFAPGTPRVYEVAIRYVLPEERQ